MRSDGTPKTAPISAVDDLRFLLKRLPAGDESAREAAEQREPRLIKPRGSLGRLEPLVARLATWQGRHPPQVDRPRLQLFVGNHGVARYGVSAYPMEVTAQMVAATRSGRAAVNVICDTFGIDLRMEVLDLESPTRPFHQDAAMTGAEFVAALNVGLAVDLDGVDILCIGETGIGNTASAAALALGLFGGTARDWTGPGSGVTGDALENKIQIVSEGANLHASAATDPVDLLRRLGGRELAAMTGAIVAARLQRVPVVLDGFTVCAAAACLQAFAPDALDHCILGHLSREPGHKTLAKNMGFEPILQLGMALGEGTGAAMAIPVLRAACNCHARMATFDEAGVADGH